MSIELPGPVVDFLGVIGMKTEAIAQLAVMAATFVADQAAAVVTLGIAEAAEVAVVAAARKVVTYLEASSCSTSWAR